MNEQNNGLTNVQNSQQPVPAQPTIQPAVAQPVVEMPAMAPTPTPVPEVPTPTPVAEVPAPTPAAPVPDAQPAVVAPIPMEVPTPVAAPTPTPVEPVAPTPVVAPTSVVAPTPEFTSAQPVAQPAASPAPVAQTDIVASAPLNPIANNATIAPANQVGPDTAQPVSPTPANNGGVGFVANGAPLQPKKSKKGIVVGGIVAALVILGVLGYFVIYPFIVKKLVTPSVVYESAIQIVSKKLTSSISDATHDKVIYEIEADLDTNIPQFAAFSGYTYGINTGLDITKQSFQAGLYMKNSSTEYSLWSYLKDAKSYSRFSTDNVLNYMGTADQAEVNELFATFKEKLESQANSGDENLNYLINKISELLISSLNENKLSQEETTLELNNENVKVLNNKYVLDEEVINATAKHIIEGLAKDDKAVKALAAVTETPEEQIKQMLVYQESEKTEDDEKEATVLTMNIYTNTKAIPIGFALTDDKGNADLHYYFSDNYFEFEYYQKTEDEETNKDIENNIEVVGITRGEKTNVTVTVNKNKIATAVITKNTDTEFELEYEVTIMEGQSITGTFKSVLTDTDERTKVELGLTMKMAGQYINVGLRVCQDWTSEVAKINTGNAVTLTEDELNAKAGAFMMEFYSTPVGMMIKSLSENSAMGGLNAGLNTNVNNGYYEITTDGEDNDFSDVIVQDNLTDDEIIIPEVAE